MGGDLTRHIDDELRPSVASPEELWTVLGTLELAPNDRRVALLLMAGLEPGLVAAELGMSLAAVQSCGQRASASIRRSRV